MTSYLLHYFNYSASYLNTFLERQLVGDYSIAYTALYRLSENQHSLYSKCRISSSNLLLYRLIFDYFKVVGQ